MGETLSKVGWANREAKWARWRSVLSDETGAATAEYAIATMAAVGFAGLLVVIMRSDEVRQILLDLVRAALNIDLATGQN